MWPQLREALSDAYRSCLQIVITNGNLDIVDDGLEFVIRTEKAVLDKFDSFPTFRV